jgi:hypothetical protein
MSPLLVLLAGVTFPQGLAPVDSGAPAPELSAQRCAPCHGGAHAEWQESRHGRAWTNAIFQREFRQDPLDWCVHCHAPLREQFTEVSRGGGPLADEGVTCAVCHLRGGKMQARTAHPGSPHDTVASADFGGPGFCGGCHQFNFPFIDRSGPHARVAAYSTNPMQDTVAQHARGPRAAIQCVQCHAASPGGHAFPGGHDPAMLARAVTVETCRAGGSLQVRLENAGAGHNVPTGDLHRHLVLRLWRSSAPERLHETILGRRFAPAPDGSKRAVADTTLRPGERRTIPVPLGALGGAAGDPVRLELRFVYTIDEFPFRGHELPVPTYATIAAREIDLGSLASCGKQVNGRPDRVSAVGAGPSF